MRWPRSLEEVQFTVVEGPCITAAASGEPVYLTDWDPGARRWSLFASALRERCPDIAAVHAFPLWAGDGVLGSLDMASTAPKHGSWHISRMVVTKIFGTI
ncbi:GAF domain-containing protein [Streptomyces sp. NPDC000658]|uniref:GAF domain-containing protein n=1 Tax=Streptomyces sp. NPDC000658 TaxID=3154266 RepID=UPI00333470F3